MIDGRDIEEIFFYIPAVFKLFDTMDSQIIIPIT